jgi:signal transduction histidine kinase/ligand-binding sensor domain-containing protein/DNA-binding response OmpR family regulator
VSPRLTHKTSLAAVILAGFVWMLVFSLVPALSLHAQMATFESINLPTGLELGHTYDISQDRQGYLWATSAKGLLRYDGYEWVTYRHDSANANTLAADELVAVCPTRDGMVWVGTWGMGLDRLDPETGNVTHHLLANRKTFNWEENFINVLLEDHLGNVWIGTNAGLYRRDVSSGNFTHYKPIAGDSTSLSDGQVQAIYEDRAGTLWIGTGNPNLNTPRAGGLNKMDQQTGRFTRYMSDAADAYSLTDNRVQSIFEDSRGTFWIGTAGDGLHSMDRDNGKFTHYPYNPEHPERLSRPFVKNQWRGIRLGVRAIGEDREGRIWIGAYAGGVNCYDPATDRVTHFEAGEPGGLPDNFPMRIFRSREGVLWIGTDLGKLIKVTSLTGPIVHQDTRAAVHVFRKDNEGTFWLGTVAGIVAVPPVGPAAQTLLRQAARQTTLLTDHVTRMDQDRRGDWWMSAWENGLYHYQSTTGRFTHYRHDSLRTNSLGPANVVSTYEDRQGTFWVMTEGGLERLEDRSGAFTHFRHDDKDTTSISSNVCMGAMEDRTGAFWILTLDGGLNLMDRQTGKFTHFLKGMAIIQLLEDAHGELWVAAHFNGLYRFDRSSKRFVPFLDMYTGKPLPVAIGLVEDNAGYLWVTSANGVAAISPTRDSLAWFGMNYGIRGMEDLYFCSVYKNEKGTLFYGGESGYYSFQPEQLLKQNTVSPLLAIVGLRINNQAVNAEAGGPLREGLSTVSTLHLSHDQDAFSFHFAVIDYRHPELHQYTYRLENYDNDWRPTDAGRTADYHNVAPGAYVFRVKGSNSDGVWVERAITIIVAPPWWRTPWAYALFGVAVVCLFYGGWRYLLGRERIKNEQQLKQLKADQLLEIERLKSRFFANISHELRTPLTLILGPLEKKLSAVDPDDPDKQDFELMQRNARQLLHLVNQLLDLSKFEAGKMKLQTQPGELIEFFNHITASFESLAGRRNIGFHVQLPVERLWVYFDADKLEKVLNNLLSNAFKFTPDDGEVFVSLNLDSGNTKQSPGKTFVHMTLSVRDTGIGIPADQLGQIFDRFHQVDHSLTREQEGTGIGLSLTRELVELHQGTITVTSALGRGSQFTVSLVLEHVSPQQLGSDTSPHHTPSAFQRVTTDKTVDAIAASTEEDVGVHAPLVLVVEDHADLRGFLRSALSANGCHVVEAIDGQAGYEEALHHIPDLIISDIMMPRMDGMQLCNRLKTDERTSHIPIILLTAKASRDSKVEGLDTGADDYLTKPFEARELFSRINNLIEGRRKLKARYSREVLLQPKAIAITSADERFLVRAMAVIERYLGESEFSVEQMGKEVGMSRMQLYRKLQALTGQAPNDFIKTMRLQRAAQLLAKGSGTVSEISYQVGFSSHSYFSKCFVEQYGKTPSDYMTEQAGVS